MRPFTLLGENWNFCVFLVKTADSATGARAAVRGNFQKAHAPHMEHLDVLPGDHQPASHSVQVEDELAPTTADSVPVLQAVQVAAFPTE
jgi:hypothetical protein